MPDEPRQADEAADVNADAHAGPRSFGVRQQLTGLMRPGILRAMEAARQQMGQVSNERVKEALRLQQRPELVSTWTVIKSPALQASLESMRQRIVDALPPNWPEDVDLDLASRVIVDEGVPLAYVPRLEIVTELLAAPDRAARIQILLARDAEVAADAEAALTSVTRPDLQTRVPLAQAAVKAYGGGHPEAALALAVLVSEGTIFSEYGPYEQAKKATKYDDEVPLWELRLKTAVAPVGAFYESWFPNRGKPAPVPLSRHVVVHQADTNNYTREHALVAIMLVASLMLALHEEHVANSS